ncbi:DUF6934 family protein [Puia dinghuensis]|uniref:Uncharacterized protein n=1 Tax=Puia dinghuensis TaxID=1792502 RepID=A0A8J2UBW7_9BACT|nr:hypothetical protein [Puia dinghuensis]GGA94078.1 hypothetical protein GCM10011511_16740 [Puia dinghuensis]
MAHVPYPYKQVRSTRYTFFSLGKTRIEKVVEFVPYGIRNVINLGFGDLRSDGTIDDVINSNNGDIAKVLATVIEILRHFTSQHPDAVIYFEGSTKKRNRFYSRILKTYYSVFSKEFILLAIKEGAEDSQLITFDPTKNTEYSAFLIKRIV